MVSKRSQWMGGSQESPDPRMLEPGPARVEPAPRGPASWCERLRSWGHACMPLMAHCSFGDSSTHRMVFDFYLLTNNLY